MQSILEADLPALGVLSECLWLLQKVLSISNFPTCKTKWKITLDICKMIRNLYKMKLLIKVNSWRTLWTEKTWNFKNCRQTVPFKSTSQPIKSLYNALCQRYNSSLLLVKRISLMSFRITGSVATKFNLLIWNGMLTLSSLMVSEDNQYHHRHFFNNSFL